VHAGLSGAGNVDRQILCSHKKRGGAHYAKLVFCVLWDL
jgi:hypothetical protein